MHLWYEVHMYNGRYSSRKDITASIDRVFSAIGDPTVKRSVIRDGQRVGGRLLALVQKLGWHVLLSDELTSRKIRILPQSVFDYLMEYLDEQDKQTGLFAKAKSEFDQRIPTEDLINWIIQVVTEVFGDLRFAMVVVNDIKSVNINFAIDRRNRGAFL